MRNRSYSIAQDSAGKLDITVQTKAAVTGEIVTAANLEVSMGVFTYSGNGDGVGATPASLISTDKPNDLKLGSDNKLLSQPKDTDFLADYILASN